MSNYILLFYVSVFTYPCLNPNAGFTESGKRVCWARDLFQLPCWYASNCRFWYKEGWWWDALASCDGLPAVWLEMFDRGPASVKLPFAVGCDWHDYAWTHCRIQVSQSTLRFYYWLFIPILWVALVFMPLDGQNCSNHSCTAYASHCVVLFKVHNHCDMLYIAKWQQSWEVVQNQIHNTGHIPHPYE